MNRIEKKLKLSDEKFKRRIGTTKSVFLRTHDRNGNMTVMPGINTRGTTSHAKPNEE
jgi:hypothetical protein